MLKKKNDSILINKIIDVYKIKTAQDSISQSIDFMCVEFTMIFTSVRFNFLSGN